MATITYTITKNGSTGKRGIAKKGPAVFVINELQSSWKLKSGTDAVKFELVYSKKDFATFDELRAELVSDGYTVE